MTAAPANDFNLLAIDIGGANLKAAHARCTHQQLHDLQARTHDFALWRDPDQLATQLQSILSALPAFDLMLITMTAELCDCFATKRDGVRHVIDHAQRAAGTHALRVYLTDGCFVDPHAACERVLEAAASNWHAQSAWLAARYPHDASLLIDCGSTTTDIIPLDRGRVVAQGLTDLDRLASGELVYVGGRRTPLMALGSTVTIPGPCDRLPNGRPINLMNELFAHTADLMILTGNMPEAPADCDTADGQPLTRAASRRRVARMVGGDTDMLSDRDVDALAAALLDQAVDLLAESVRRVAARHAPGRAIVSGSTASLAARVARRAMPELPIVDLAAHVSDAGREAACAVALLHLYAGRDAAGPAAAPGDPSTGAAPRSFGDA